MLVARGLAVVSLVLGLFACDADEQSASAPDAAVYADWDEPLAGLTDARLDQFVAICRTAEADADRDATQIAVSRGWSQIEWLKLCGRIQSISRAGGFDGFMAKAREAVAEIEASGDAIDPIVTARVEESRRLLEREATIRPGGLLIEARLMELEEYLPD